MSIFGWMTNAGRRKPRPAAPRPKLMEQAMEEHRRVLKPEPEPEPIVFTDNDDGSTTVTVSTNPPPLEELTATLRSVTGEAVRAPARWDADSQNLVIGPMPKSLVFNFVSIEDQHGQVLAFTRPNPTGVAECEEFNIPGEHLERRRR